MVVPVAKTVPELLSVPMPPLFTIPVYSQEMVPLLLSVPMRPPRLAAPTVLPEIRPVLVSEPMAPPLPTPV